MTEGSLRQLFFNTARFFVTLIMTAPSAITELVSENVRVNDKQGREAGLTQ